MDDCAYGQETGRTWIVDDAAGGVIVSAEPDHDEWAVWTEFKDADGEFTYVSDHEGYALTAEEFGPIPDGDRHCDLCHRYEEHARDCGAVNPTALAMLGREALVIKK